MEEGKVLSDEADLVISQQILPAGKRWIQCVAQNSMSSVNISLHLIIERDNATTSKKGEKRKLTMLLHNLSCFHLV